MMDQAARRTCEQRGERQRTTRSGYVYYLMQPGCPEHDVRTTYHPADPEYRNPTEGTTP